MKSTTNFITLKLIVKVALTLMMFSAWGSLSAQQKFYENYRVNLAAAKVKSCTTYDALRDSAIVSEDQYDRFGNKTQAIEVYENGRQLKRLVNGEWKKGDDRTKFSFTYNEHGNQLSMINHNFDPEQRYQLFKYDKFGNIERYEFGRTFSAQRSIFYRYDEHGTVVKECFCYDDTCNPEESFGSKWAFNVSNYFVSYNEHGDLYYQIANYMDAASGWKYHYKYDDDGNMIRKKEYFVHSMFGVGKEVITLADMVSKTIMFQRYFAYTNTGELKKETVLVYEGDDYYKERIFAYNKQGLIVKEDLYDKVLYHSYSAEGLRISTQEYWGEENPQLRAAYFYTYEYWTP